MSRTLKRVDLAFDWPIGYVNPYADLSTKCPDCDHGHDRAGGRPDANATLFKEQWYGYAAFDPIAYGGEPLAIDHPAIRAFAAARRSPSELAIRHEVARLHRLWSAQWSHQLSQVDVDALVAEGRLWDLTSQNPHPTAAEVNTWAILSPFGHDAQNEWVCVRARCLREGVPYECQRCHGSGELWPSPEIEAQYESWAPSEPPVGEGYQLWEDDFPLSPVFTTLDALSTWAADHATTFGSERASKAEWHAMLEENFVHARIGNNILR